MFVLFTFILQKCCLHNKLKMKNKKAVELSLNVIVIAVIILIVLIVSIVIFTGLVGESASDTKITMRSITKDSDGDGIKDFLDKCPCYPGTAEYNGCPEDITDENREKYTSRDCLKH